MRKIQASRPEYPLNNAIHHCRGFHCFRRIFSYILSVKAVLRHCV
ncbi:hypothetical protein M5D96_013456 [Drosophila gunungcola]|uniref:Uncharacterized protein n=1 Tax=Drosophila gunungcola TaxID=103775 RepID=A0A9Q0BJ44_9MUSC|nr:hypothetical protein M5D96_013456 [Drosophila gunungcola]